MYRKMLAWTISCIRAIHITAKFRGKHAKYLLATVQVEAHHYCSHLSEDVRQCVIYDSDASDARLIGVEYIISRRLFDSLPEEEKKYWHSHTYEVRWSGESVQGACLAVEGHSLLK